MGRVPQCMRGLPECRTWTLAGRGVLFGMIMSQPKKKWEWALFRADLDEDKVKQPHFEAGNVTSSKETSRKAMGAAARRRVVNHESSLWFSRRGWADEPKAYAKKLQKQMSKIQVRPRNTPNEALSTTAH